MTSSYFVERTADIAKRVRNSLAQWTTSYQRRRAWSERFDRVYAELSSATDRDLADVGISRLNIREIAYEAADAC